MTKSSRSCVFCPQPSVLWRGDSVYALFDVAPIVEGHLLICSIDHHPCAADAPAEVIRELDVVTGWLRDVYLRTYGSFTLFEHGRTGHCLRRSPVDRICHHMHVHVLPLPGDLVRRVPIGQRARWESWAEVSELGRDIDGYVVVETIASGRTFYPTTRSLPSHYLRTLAAESVGDPSLADWEALVGNPSNAQLIQAADLRLRAAFARPPVVTPSGPAARRTGRWE